MGSIFKAPKMPDPAPMQMPSTDDVPEVDDAEMEAEQEQKLKDLEKKRKGRRSTILTGTGLNEIEDENIQKKTLLGS
jgi:hypothetical protein